MASEKVLVVTKDSFEEDILKADKLVVVDFWAPWCGPCRAVSPIMDELATSYGDQIKVCKVNVDDEGELAAKFRIMSIPTLMFFKNGESVDKVIGARSKEELSIMIDKHM